jgi:hypothetical protein
MVHSQLEEGMRYLDIGWEAPKTPLFTVADSQIAVPHPAFNVFRYRKWVGAGFIVFSIRN